MPKRRFPLVAFLVLAPLLAGLMSTARLRADDAATTPTLIVRLASIERVLAEIKYLSDLSGKTEDAKKLDAVLKMAMPKGKVEGIDGKRPLGLYFYVDPDGNLMEFKFLVMLPVSDEKSFIG